MFTPKQESPIMLEDETVHIGTQKSRVYCSLPRKKTSPLVGVWTAEGGV